MDIELLKEKIGEIEDPQRPWGNLRYKLKDIIVIGLLTLLYNEEDFDDMEDFGEFEGFSGTTSRDTRFQYVFPGISAGRPESIDSLLVNGWRRTGNIRWYT
jgi:hypothetical protein